ncbi:variable surface protein [Plasmodium gonderi]|uniref:Variable surface protein n=1 Tax=Plasmodium gonderi TaxID=77519 RepID=A0A1Y1JU85_PLAGO|nr:variable surface protein [Plasmodium gonderi]GAW84312.1 variable surface protein [Plasmodium gonderi]
MEEAVSEFSPQLKVLSSYVFYQKLINQKNENNISDLCKDVLNIYTNDQGLDYKFCGQLIKNIEMLRNDNDDFFRKKHCLDVNYWLFSEVYKNLEGNTEMNDFDKIFNMFVRIWQIILADCYSVRMDKERCYPFKNLFKGNFLKYLIQVKNFFDYIQNYNIIRNKINKNTYYACQKYSNYLKDRLSLFFSFEPLCKKQESYIFTDHFYSYYHLLDPRNIFTWYKLFKIYIQSFWNGCYKNILNKNEKSAKRVDQVIHGREQGTQINVSMTNATVPSREIPKEINKNHGNLSDFVNEQGFSISKIAFYVFFLC